MNSVQRKAFETEIGLARVLMREKRDDEAFAHLERAHVLGQQAVLPHVLSHWLMLGVAVHRRDAAAVVGQVARVVLGALGSALGFVPTGNTGGTDVSMFAHLPIEPELSRIIDGHAATDP